MPSLEDVAAQLEFVLQKFQRTESARGATPFNEKAYRHARTLLTAAIYELADTIATGGKVTISRQDGFSEPGTAVVVPERPKPMLLRPIAAPKDVLVAQNETRALIQETLEKERDYGRVPGTDKDTLFKAGAERVILAFGCFAQFRVIEKEVDHDRVNTYMKKGKEQTSQGLYRYVVECQIVNRANGEVVGSFIGSCSSMESKYISRPRDSENTIVKMGEKRALVGATLTTFGLSDQFTQDVEEAGTQPEAEKPPVKTMFTLDEAAAFPFPFKKGEAIHGKPLGELPTKALVSVRDWIRQVQQDNESFHQDTIAAINVVLEAREKDQTKLDLVQGDKSEVVTDDELEEDRRELESTGVLGAEADLPF